MAYSKLLASLEVSGQQMKYTGGDGMQWREVHLRISAICEAVPCQQIIAEQEIIGSSHLYGPGQSKAQPNTQEDCSRHERDKCGMEDSELS